MRFGIRAQALLLAVVPALCLVALVFVSSALVDRTREVTLETQQLTAVLSFSDKMMAELTAGTQSLGRYAASRRPGDLRDYRAALRAFGRDAADFRAALAHTPRLRAIGTQYANKLQSGIGLLESYYAADRRGGIAAARRVSSSAEAKSYGPQMQHVRIAFDEAAQPRTLRSISIARDSMRTIQAGMIVAVMLALALTFVGSLLFAMRIVKRLGRLGENAKRLAAGVPAIPVSGGDEIAQLDLIYRTMAEKIQASSRSIALLQRALLPELPRIANLQVDSFYAAPDNANIGGDWFDVFVLSESRLGLSIGDVTGHGLHAATAMGYVRQALRIVARRESDPAAVMRDVNDVLCSDERGIIVTAFFGVLERAGGRLSYAIAGHAPPIVASPGGDVSALAGAGMLLGIESGIEYTRHERVLAPGESLVLFTDGVVEVDRDYARGLADLEAAIRAEVAAPSNDRAHGIARRIFRAKSPSDDAAILVVTLPAVREWEFDARSMRAGRRVKKELLAALAALGAHAPDPATVEIVYGELLSNVVRHTPGAARVSFRLADAGIVLDVHDRGHAFGAGGTPVPHGAPPADAESGRGLFLISALCAHVSVTPTPDGKCTSVLLPSAHDGSAQGKRTSPAL